MVQAISFADAVNACVMKYRQAQIEKLAAMFRMDEEPAQLDYRERKSYDVTHNFKCHMVHTDVRTTDSLS